MCVLLIMCQTLPLHLQPSTRGNCLSKTNTAYLRQILPIKHKYCLSIVFLVLNSVPLRKKIMRCNNLQNNIRFNNLQKYSSSKQICRIKSGAIFGKKIFILYANLQKIVIRKTNFRRCKRRQCCPLPQFIVKAKSFLFLLSFLVGLN